MPNTVLLGAQWGDEGKGKIIDVLTEEADWIVRYQGGNNAGHTIEFEGTRHVLHLVPSGILREGKRCVIGHGVVVDPLALLAEIEELAQAGVETKGRLKVSDRAHIVFPFHRAMDSAREDQDAADRRIGTTRRGIGPCYGDKAARVGMRVGDLLERDFRERAESILEEKNRVLKTFGIEPLDVEEVLDAYDSAGKALAGYVDDTIPLLNEAIASDEAVLFEGAQGTMLDIDCGTYPFVTSSSTTAGGVCVGTGVPPSRIDHVLGVVKGYTTRVGEGPFPTELTDQTGEDLRKHGNEFGATTGRPRRCGWFDGVVARYSVMVNGITSWAMTKLDVLDHMETVRICTAYEVDGKRIEHMPANARLLARCRPVYEDWPGWLCSTGEAQSFDELPERARAYVRRIEELTSVPVGILSLGPGRERTLRLDGKA